MLSLGCPDGPWKSRRQPGTRTERGGKHGENVGAGPGLDGARGSEADVPASHDALTRTHALQADGEASLWKARLWRPEKKS